jgi:tRNA pseudouridine55 synthase
VPTERRARLDGIVVVDKPAGITSAGVVRVVKRRLDAEKIGHLGTLDPFATGVLPLAVGEGSKLVPFLNEDDKAYVGTVALGRATNTLDSTGETTEERPVPPLSAAAIEEAASRFRGEIAQVPPMFSALKRDGRRLYDLARRGVEVELSPRSVKIHSLVLRPLDDRTLELSARCGKGTYVRSLARDIAAALGTVGHLALLRRTECGRFRVAEAIPLAEIERGASVPIVALREALPELREIAVDDAMVERIRRGQQYALSGLPRPSGAAEVVKILGMRGELVALLQARGSGWAIARVLAPATVDLDSV